MIVALPGKGGMGEVSLAAERRTDHGLRALH